MNIEFLNMLTNGKEVVNGIYEDDYKIIKVLDDCVELYTKQNNKFVKVNMIKIHENLTPIAQQISLWYNGEKMSHTLRFKKGTSDKEKQYVFDNYKDSCIMITKKKIKFN